MIFVNFNPKIHDVSKVAKLVYDIDFRTFDLLFRDENKAIDAIKKDLSKINVNDSLKVILNENNEIMGMLEFYISEMPYSFSLKSPRLYVVDILDYFVLSDIAVNDLYIAEFAVDEHFRGRGLGSKVLLEIIEYAKSEKISRVILDVDFRNTVAKSLYEKLGFKVFNKKRVKLGSFERGMYNMELIL